jgi:hypothetical protein
MMKLAARFVPLLVSATVASCTSVNLPLNSTDAPVDRRTTNHTPAALVTVASNPGGDATPPATPPGARDQWFVGPAALPDPAKLFDGYVPADMNPDLGDSAIVETYGLGALAVAASPVAAESVGIDPATIDAIDTKLRAIAAGESPNIRYPDGRAAMLGVDARKVAATRIAPPVHTGIAHSQPGIGQIGGGVTHPPLIAFDLAVEALG